MTAKYAIKSLLIGLLAAGWLAMPAVSNGQVSLAISIGPPPLPVYEQPPIPAPGYLWTPGYWAYGPEGYFWVPGTWVQPPAVGLLWTPGYWGWSAGAFMWNAGYWGPQVGFYGGVNYGFGYGGRGYEGGYWRDRQFYYNRSVNQINNVEIHNVYNKTVINNVTVQRVSYAGGPGGVVAQPTPEEQQASRQAHTAPTPAQTQHREGAAAHHELLASVNQGKPQIAATARPNDFSGHVVAANRAGGPMPAASKAPSEPAGKGAPAVAATHPGSAASGPTPPAAAVAAPVHARDLPKPAPAATPSAAASASERKNAQDQAALQGRQAQEREALAQQQERDHAKMAAQAKNSQSMAALEHQHQQQTQQLQQRHTAEQQPHGPPQTAHAPAPPHHSAPPPPPQQHQGPG